MTHSGTHIDAPWHFVDDGKRLDEMDCGVFFGPALVIEVPQADAIEPSHLRGAPLPDRILFKTRNSGFPVDDPFRKDYVAVSPEAAQCLVDLGVRLVGVDGLSVAPWKQEGQVTHHLLLGNDVVVVEGLRLEEIPAGTHWFTVLPLPLAEADGAPCRAFVGVEETP
jgi:arylformamidase